MPKVIYSVNGGVTWFEAPEGVRVAIEGVAAIDEALKESAPARLDINLTHEGIIVDLWETLKQPLDNIVATNSVMYGDLIETH